MTRALFKVKEDVLVISNGIHRATILEATYRINAILECYITGKQRPYTGWHYLTSYHPTARAMECQLRKLYKPSGFSCEEYITELNKDKVLEEVHE